MAEMWENHFEEIHVGSHQMKFYFEENDQVVFHWLDIIFVCFQLEDCC